MTTKLPKSCEVCVHFTKHTCQDSEGNPILKYDASENKYVELEEPYWTYVECAKNWGLPKVAHTSAKDCNFYKQKEIK